MAIKANRKVFRSHPCTHQYTSGTRHLAALSRRKFGDWFNFSTHQVLCLHQISNTMTKTSNSFKNLNNVQAPKLNPCTRANKKEYAIELIIQQETKNRRLYRFRY